MPAAIRLGRVDPARVDQHTPEGVDAAVAEMEQLYDAAGLVRSIGDDAAPGAVAVRVRSAIRSGRYRLLDP